MSVYIRKYATLLTATTAGSMRIRIPIRKAGSADFATSSDWTPVAADTKVSIDGGTPGNATNAPSYSNGSWEFTLTAAELTGKSIEVRIVDSATKAVDDEGFNVETFGNASAMWPTDYVDAVRLGLTALPNAAAEAAGGLYTRGTGAGQINQPANGMVDVNAVRHLGTAYPTPSVAGVPEVDIVLANGAVFTTATPPPNFSSLGINASGHISRVTLVDDVTTKTGYSLSGAGVTAVQSGLSTLTALQVRTEMDANSTKLAVLTKVDGMLVLDGAVYQFTANALELGPTTSVATNNVTVEITDTQGAAS